MAACMIRTDQAELVVCGGADAPINRVSFASFDQAGLSSRRNDQPGKASRPFDRDCDSGVISEGAGIVFLENYAHAEARNAKPYLEIVGMGSHADMPGGASMSGLARAMELALANAGMSTTDVDFICAHGPGHPVIDLAETQVIKSVFGSDAYRVPVTSIKGNTGNPLAAAGPMQIIACALCLQSGLIHPIANHENPGIGCDLDYVAGRPRLTHPRVGMINAHGMGGGNSCMIVRKVDFQ
jgi:3-oxoacyl-[acyl-carrier-protein] synthase II